MAVARRHLEALIVSCLVSQHPPQVSLQQGLDLQEKSKLSTTFPNDAYLKLVIGIKRAPCLVTAEQELSSRTVSFGSILVLNIA